MQIKIKEALANLKTSENTFLELFNNRSISVEVYKPVSIDYQQPHDRDEIYVIISGFGDFYLEEAKYEFQPHDFFFVPAGKVHTFSDFTDDFSTWVIFLNSDKENVKSK
jgi:mannose-6-phosphate isomerase-like protein (cupin superfamily)